MNDRTFRLASVLGVVILGIAAYANTVDGGWVWDDASSVLLHKHVQDPAQVLQLFREDQHAFGRGQGNFYRPLVAVSFMLDCVLSGATQPVSSEGPRPEIPTFIFHLSNMAWHIGAALMLLALLVRLGAPGAVCAVVPAIFVVHPLHTEAVAYISGRADMMAALFLFAALYFAAGAVEPKRRMAEIAASALCFVLALLSKESALIYPVLLALVLLVRGRASGQSLSALLSRNAAPLGAAVVIAVGYAVLRSTALRFAERGETAAAPLLTRCIETVQAFALYLRLLFVPTGLHMERTLAGAGTLTTLLGLLLLAAAVAGCILAWRARQHRIALGLGWFLLTWLPISGIFPLNAPMAEHWMYVPMAGFWWVCAEAAMLAARSAAPRRAALTAAAALLLLFTALTANRNEDWHSNETLFRATLERNPDSMRVRYNLAVAYQDIDGNLPGARREFEALAASYRARHASRTQDTALGEDEIDVRLSLADVLFRTGDYMPAVEHYRAVASPANRQHSTQVARAIRGLAYTYLALGDIQPAIAYLNQMAALDPNAQPLIERLMLGAPIPGAS